MSPGACGASMCAIRSAGWSTFSRIDDHASHT
jgi:hypothetical protein